MDLQGLYEAKGTFDALLTALTKQMRDSALVVDPSTIQQMNLEGSVPLLSAAASLSDSLLAALIEIDARLAALEP